MDVEVVPAVNKQRELVELPRTMERFEAYVRSMIRDDVVELPLFTFNPMSREHVGEVLDRLIAFDAEAAAGEAGTDAGARLDAGDDLRLVIVVADDVRGGWTNRFITDYELRFTKKALMDGWAQLVVWASEGADEQSIRRDAMAAVFRYSHLRANGLPSTLRDIFVQEGGAYRFAGSPERGLDPDDLRYTLEAAEPYLGATGRDVHIAVLYGDDAAREVGYEPLGFSRWAGLAAAYEFASSGTRRRSS